MKRLLTLSVIALFTAFCLQACSNEDDNKRDEIIKNIDTEKKEEAIDIFQGYQVSDTIGIRKVQFRESRRDSNLIFISGIKKGKVWYGKFDKTTKKPIFEVEDQQEFNKTQSVHLGYGEYRDITVDKVVVIDGIQVNNTDCIHIAFIEECEEGFDFLVLSTSRIDFINDNKITKSLYKEDYSSINLKLYEWIDSIISEEDSKYYSYSLCGDINFESLYGYNIFYYTEAYSPYSMEDCIVIVASAGIIRTISIQKFNMKKEFKEWSTNISEAHMDDRIINPIFNYENDECNISFDILSKSGDKKTIETTINIETGNIILLD